MPAEPAIERIGPFGAAVACATAVQARAALTDRIAFTATKDGYVWLRPNEAVPSSSGWANVAFGFKGAMWKDEDSASIVSIGPRYEAPGATRTCCRARVTVC